MAFSFRCLTNSYQKCNQTSKEVEVLTNRNEILNEKLDLIEE